MSEEDMDLGSCEIQIFEHFLAILGDFVEEKTLIPLSKTMLNFLIEEQLCEKSAPNAPRPNQRWRWRCHLHKVHNPDVLPDGAYLSRRFRFMKSFVNFLEAIPLELINNSDVSVGEAITSINATNFAHFAHFMVIPSQGSTIFTSTKKAKDTRTRGLSHMK
jgi:hypothetical protein